MTPTELYNHISETDGIPMQELNPLQYELMQIAEEAEGLRGERQATGFTIPSDVAEVGQEVAKRIELYSQGNDIFAQALAAVEEINIPKRKSEVWAIIAARLAEVGDIAQANAVADKIYIPFNSSEKISALLALYVATHDTAYMDRAAQAFETISTATYADKARVNLAVAQAKVGNFEAAWNNAEAIASPIYKVDALTEIYVISQDTAHLDQALAVSETMQNNTMEYKTGKKFLALALARLGRIGDAFDLKKKFTLFFDDVYIEIADFHAKSGDINQALSACDSISHTLFKTKALAVVYASTHDPAILSAAFDCVTQISAPEWQADAYEAIAEAQAATGDITEALETAERINLPDLKALALSAVAQAIFKEIGNPDSSDTQLTSPETTS
ncbi:hypothetical protein KBC99_00055 [Candidatus Saccharibacteria bacterium]|nr:hypothetical protein [Candidatus Saccharibacteria bacterium]